jgi:hypothetical protein
MVWPVPTRHASGVTDEVLLIHFISELKREIGEAVKDARANDFVKIRIESVEKLVECIHNHFHGHVHDARDVREGWI